MSPEFRRSTHLFTSESVTMGHPDKVADQISDAVLDAILAQDPTARVACETLVTTGQVILAGEVTTTAYVDAAQIARETIKEIGYTHAEIGFDCFSCGVLSAIHSQSPDIARGVDHAEDNEKEQGAGDQGFDVRLRLRRDRNVHAACRSIWPTASSNASPKSARTAR